MAKTMEAPSRSRAFTATLGSAVGVALVDAHAAFADMILSPKDAAASRARAASEVAAAAKVAAARASAEASAAAAAAAQRAAAQQMQFLMFVGLAVLVLMLVAVVMLGRLRKTSEPAQDAPIE